MTLRAYLCVAAASALIGAAFSACNTAGSGGAIACTDGGSPCPNGLVCSHGMCVAPHEGGSTGGSSGSGGSATGGSGGTSTGGSGTGGSGTGGSGVGGTGGSGVGGTGGSGVGGTGGSGVGGTGGSGVGGTGGSSATGGSGGTGGSPNITLPAGCLTNPSQWQMDCNPVTNQGCVSGAACDVNGTTGWKCYAGPNPQQLGQTCDESAGPYCAGTLTCMATSTDAGAGDAGTGTAGICKHYCCSNSDCNGGTCTPFPNNIGTLGTCN